MRSPRGHERDATQNELFQSISVMRSRKHFGDLRRDNPAPPLENRPNVFLLLRARSHQFARAITVLSHGHQLLPLQYGLDRFLKALTNTPEDEEGVPGPVLVEEPHQELRDDLVRA